MTDSLPTSTPTAIASQKRPVSTRAWSWWMSAIGLILFPFILITLLMASRQTLYTDLFPFWNDEVYYWHQAATFAHVGLEGGYYTYNEVPAQAPFSHYNTWGILIPAFYGQIAGVFGWPSWAIPVTNLMLMCLAVALWVAVVRPRLLQMGVAVMVLMFGPFIMYSPTSMSEVMHMAWGIVIASMIFALWKRRETPQVLWWGLITLSLITFAAGLRVTWGILLPIVGAMWLSRWGWRGLVVGAAVGVILAGSIYSFYNWTAAPFPGNLITPAIFKAGLGQGLLTILAHAQENIISLLAGPLSDLVIRAEVLGLWVVVCVTFLRQRQTPRRITRPPYDLWELLIYSALTVGLFFLLIVFYTIETGHDSRQFACFLMCFSFLAVAHQRWRLLIVFIGSSLLMLFPSVQTFSSWVADNRNQKEIVTIMQEWKIDVDEAIQYESDARSSWCNTLSFSPSFFVPPYIPSLVEPGIGLTLLFVKSDEPLKARHLILDEWFLSAYGSEMQTELILDVPGGGIYRNLDADCD